MCIYMHLLFRPAKQKCTTADFSTVLDHFGKTSVCMVKMRCTLSQCVYEQEMV